MFERDYGVKLLQEVRRMIKRIVFILTMCLTILFIIPEENISASDYPIYVNQQIVDFDEPILMEDSRVFVPVRFIIEQIGADVFWDNSESSVTIQNGLNDKIKFFINSKTLILNGKEYVMDVTPILDNERTYLPIRHVAELLHASVKWDAINQVVHIQKKPLYIVQEGDTLSSISKQFDTKVKLLKERNQLATNHIVVGQKLKTIIPMAMSYQPDVHLLADLIHAEGEGEPFEGKVAIGNVVMNRVEDSRFPDSIKGVIYQENQFTPVKTGRIYEVSPDKESINAAKQAISGERPVGEALYFYNPIKTDDTFVHDREVITKIGNHRFAK